MQTGHILRGVESRLDQPTCRPDQLGDSGRLVEQVGDGSGQGVDIARRYEVP